MLRGRRISLVVKVRPVVSSGQPPEDFVPPEGEVSPGMAAGVERGSSRWSCGYCATFRPYGFNPGWASFCLWPGCISWTDEARLSVARDGYGFPLSELALVFRIASSAKN